MCVLFWRLDVGIYFFKRIIWEKIFLEVIFLLIYFIILYIIDNLCVFLFFFYGRGFNSVDYFFMFVILI